MLPTSSQQAWPSIRPGKEVTPAAKIMQCDCGYVVRGDSDDELVANVQQHAREVHDRDHQGIVREKTYGKAKEDKR